MKIKSILEQSLEIKLILEIIRDLKLEDSWLSAGTLRNYIWNVLSQKEDLSAMSDIDVVFFDQTISYETTCELEKDLKKRFPNYDWELKNQVYMHCHSPNSSAFTSSCDAISKYPEKCTAIAARLDENNELELFLPYGEKDILDFKVSPTPYFKEDSERMQIYRKRQAKKKWKAMWPNLVIEDLSS